MPEWRLLSSYGGSAGRFKRNLLRYPIVARMIHAKAGDMQPHHYLGDDPLYSIRRAAKWTMLGSDKLPSVAAVIADVKLVIGARVLDRQRVAKRDSVVRLSFSCR